MFSILNKNKSETENKKTPDAPSNKPSLLGERSKKSKNPIHYSREMYLGYKLGVDKFSYEACMSDIIKIVDTMKWHKLDVSYNIKKVTKHPNLEDGYIYEIHLLGCGYSVINSIVEQLKDINNIGFWVPCSNNNWCFVENKNRQVESMMTHLPPDVMNDKKYNTLDLSVFSKKEKTKNLYKEGYWFWYLTLILFASSLVSIPATIYIKYSAIKKEKPIISTNWYKGSKRIPFEKILDISSGTNERLVAIKHTKDKWQAVFATLAPNGEEIVTERNISK
jgi:hypothetical protein